MASEFPWLPGTFTQPLREDFLSDGPKLRRFVQLFWRSKETPAGQKFELDPWQAWLIDHVLERYPDDWPVEELRGRLRYEQCVISMGRQNGKTVLAAILGLYGLTMHVQGATVLGLAESVAQANLVYKTAKYAIDNDPYLSARFISTGTRGIRSVDGSRSYRTAPGKADALQGITVSFCLYDEVHLTPPDMWSAVVLGTGAIQDGMVLGISTAGDEESVLLASLYELGKDAADGDPTLERFGFFLWEGTDDAAIDDVASIVRANPSIACGRKDLQKTLTAVRTMPEAQARQYVHNRFVRSSGDTWLPPHLWNQLATGVLPGKPTVFAVDRSPGWEWASVTAGAKEGTLLHVEYVAAMQNPTVDRLADLCGRLARKHRATFVMDGFGLRDLANELKRRGLQVVLYTEGQICSASSTAYAQIARGNVIHDGADIVNFQMGRGVRKNKGDAWRIVRPNTATEIDGLMATVLAIHAAETLPKPGKFIV